MSSFWHKQRKHFIDTVTNALPLRKRIMIGYVLTIFFVMLLFLGTYLVHKENHSLLQTFTRYNTQSLDASRFNTYVTKLQLAAHQYIDKGFESSAPEVERINTILKSMLSDYIEVMHDNSNALEILTTIQDHLHRYMKAFRQAERQKRLQKELIEQHLPDIRESIHTQLHNRTDNKRKFASVTVTRLENRLLLISNRFYHYLHNFDPKNIKAIREDFREMKQLTAVKTDSTLQSALRKYESTINQAIQRARGYLYLINVVMSAEAHEMLYQSNIVATRLQHRMQETQTKLFGRLTWLQTTLIVISSLFLLAILGITYVMGASITTPIKKLAQIFEKIVSGSNETIKIDYKPDDELAMLIRAAESFRKKNIEIHQLNTTLETKVEQRTQELKEKNAALNKLATTDTLTSLNNRAKLNKVIDDEIIRADRYNNDFSIILMDIDHFKQINDTHGHQIGDEVLIRIAGLMRNNCRQSDVLGRWGGEEFLILCIDTDSDHAAKLAEHLRVAIETFDFGVSHQVTASFGIASYEHGMSKETVVKCSDDALYEAKRNGRNRVVTYRCP